MNRGILHYSQMATHKCIFTQKFADFLNISKHLTMVRYALDVTITLVWSKNSLLFLLFHQKKIEKNVQVAASTVNFTAKK